MRYKTVLKMCMDAYPSLFYTETDVLHHLFFVNGNGREWRDGQLVDRVMNIRSARKYIRDRLEYYIQRVKENMSKTYWGERNLEHFKKELDVLQNGTPQEQREFYYQEHIKILKTIEEFTLHADGQLIKGLYPLCEHAMIVNIPYDVKPDWLEAAIRALREIDVHLVHKCYDKKYQKQEEKSNKKFISQAWKLIGEIQRIQSWKDEEWTKDCQRRRKERE